MKTKVRKIVVGWNVAVVLLAAWLMSCAPPTTDAPAQEYFTGDHDGGGELLVRWNSDASKNLLASAVTQAADSYQLVAFSGATATTRLLKAGVDNVLSLTPGTWRIVVVAGLKRSATSSTVFLVGAASQDNVVVSNGNRTTVSLTLKSIDTTFDLVGSTVWDDNLTIRATGKSRNAVVGMFLAETSADKHPRFRSLEFWNGYKDPVVTGDPTNWSAEITAKVPEGGTDVAVWLIGAQIALLDGTGAWVPTQGILDGTWEWINRADMGDTHALVGEAERHAATQAPTTGLSVGLTWE